MKTNRLVPLVLTGIALVGCEQGPPSAPTEPDIAFAVVGSQTLERLDLRGIGELSTATAVNDAGAIVGYTSDAKGRAFLWTPTGVTDLAGLGDGPTAAYDINNAGIVVGRSSPKAGMTEAVVWEDGAITGLGTLGGSWSTANAVNDAEPFLVVGGATDRYGTIRAFVWDAGTNSMRDLHDVLGNPECSQAYDVNDRNIVVGMAGSSAFAWSEAGGVVRLPSPTGGASVALAINEADQIAGVALVPVEKETELHAVLWEGEVMTDLGTVDDYPSIANAVNDAGQVVGFSGRIPAVWRCTPSLMVELPGIPFVRDEASLVRLSVLSERADGAVLDINNTGVAVGWSGTFDAPNAVRWVIQFVPATPEEATASLEESVATLEETGSSSTGTTQSLLSKLDAITRQLNRGNVTPALRLLENFIAEVEGLVRRGELSETDGSALIATAQQALSLLNG